MCELMLIKIQAASRFVVLPVISFGGASKYM